MCLDAFTGDKTMTRAKRTLRWLMLAAAAAPLFNYVYCTADENGVYVRGDVDEDDLEDFLDDIFDD